jgi:HAD superfamily hydrolase (TIGR01484 family)
VKQSFKGIIALDIDGTVTVSKHSMEMEVADYLNSLIGKGWCLIFLTGRTYAFALPILSSLRGEYFFSPQNGASLYKMPVKEEIFRNYLPVSLLQVLDPLFKKHMSGLLVESGRENDDICYYKPADFNKREMEYLAFRQKIAPEKWIPVNAFHSLPIQEFAVGKYFAKKETALNISKEILLSMNLSVIVIRDPFRQGYYLAHINALGASKGAILEIFKKREPHLPVISAGDDYNDLEMLEKSMIKIVMKNGPEKLHKLADVLAPPASEQGIIKGLEEAIWKVSSKLKTLE